MIKYGRRRCVFLSIGMSLFLHSLAYGQLSTARISASQGRLDTVCGTHNVKVVFMCKGNCWFVDFSEATPQIRQMANVTNSFFPVVSSDGGWVTYQSGIEAEGPTGSTVPGKVWLRELAANGTPVKIADTGYVPRFVQNNPTDTLSIVYSTSVACPQQLCYSAGQTVKRKIVNKTPLPVETVFAGGSYYGGLSWDNRYLITGWPGDPHSKGFMLDLLNSASGPRAVHVMRVKKTGTGIDTFVSIQTCNISRSASRIFTNTMLYYDFGSGAMESANCYHPLLGTWNPHALLFISRYDAEDMKVFAMPSDRKIVPYADAKGAGEATKKEWYNPEWSNHPYFGVAGLNIERDWLTVKGKDSTWNQTYNTESIYLVGLKDSQYVKLIESVDTTYASTTSFSYPFLWVGIPDGFQEDTTWLAKTIWQRSSAIKPFNVRRVTTGFDRKSIPPGAQISLFTLSGRKIAAAQSGDARSAERLYKTALHGGSYIVTVKTSGKQPWNFKYATLR